MTVSKGIGNSLPSCALHELGWQHAVSPRQWYPSQLHSFLSHAAALMAFAEMFTSTAGQEALQVGKLCFMMLGLHRRL